MKNNEKIFYFLVIGEFSRLLRVASEKNLVRSSGAALDDIHHAAWSALWRRNCRVDMSLF